MSIARAQGGQGTVEYIGVLTLVAVVLAAAVAGGAVLAPGVGNAVVGQIRHALCIVTGRRCIELAAARPCVVRTARDERREAVSLGFVQLGSGRVVLRERLSDGTLRLTVLHRGRAGVSAGYGSSTRVRVGGVEVDVGAHAQGTIAGLVGGGQVFEVRTAQEADALIRRLRADGSPTLDAVRRLIHRNGKDAPHADATLVEGGIDAGVDFELAGAGLKAGATGGGENVLGRRIDRRTGQTTWYLRLDRKLPVFADALLGKASGELDGDALLAVTQDATGRLVELSAVVGGHAGAGAELGDRSVAAGSDRWEAEARVGLDDPQIAAALRAWRSSPASTDAVVALGRALRDRAALEVRRYAREGTSDEDGVEAGTGMRAGVSWGRDREATRLLTASTRPPGGLWERRLECVG